MVPCFNPAWARNDTYWHNVASDAGTAISAEGEYLFCELWYVESARPLEEYIAASLFSSVRSSLACDVSVPGPAPGAHHLIVSSLLGPVEERKLHHP